MSADDERFLRLALSLAEKARGRTSPNPLVGALIVKNGRVLSVGYHRGAGLPHAEIEALRKLKPGQARGATLYLNLEPCSHTDKRTPPCVPAIIAAGIRRVVCCMEDPNPRVKGIEQLRKAGVRVDVGLLEREARELNAAYIKHITTGLPLVTLKLALSFDGKIATGTGESKWISGGASRALVQHLRAESDAVMVGINTVLKDDPELACRIPGAKQPLRVILDSRLRIPLTARVLRDSNVMIATTSRASKRKRAALSARGIAVWASNSPRVNIRALLRFLVSRGITSVLCEGGSELAGSLVDARLVDRFVFFIAPKIIGGGGKDAVGGKGVSRLARAWKLRFTRLERVGEDILIEAKPAAPRTKCI
ncbi:MAG: bifunctional diaminohydroxyphosphoribosylaminopyrimidine deaminase/5-amino-6-(5-phosphoribosylamino)uracil reductase RibD [Candidatus Micrarchaeia archaeon]